MNNIYISNLEKLNEKIEYFKKEGKNKIHLVTDFDKTLTKKFHNDKKLPSGISLLRSGKYLTPEYAQKAQALFDKYHPYEIDNSLDIEFRKQKMHEWWSNHEKLLISSGLKIDAIKDIAKNNPKIYREHVLETFDFLKENNIPILIFSASGLGNLIELSLKEINRFYSNIHILTNIFKFDEQGNPLGYKGQIIHVCNKSEIDIKDPGYKTIIQEKENVILLGDTLDDIGMVEKINTKSLISIGFLNDSIEENLKEYKKVYDIVITNDGSFKYVLELLKEVTNFDKRQ